MFPQAELENYKLQVELLQEKLQRSEDNRQQLEHKLDKILQKRTELDKSARQKSRQKYQEFLEEQSKRNERNKKLVTMLERIDEQTAIMSQRSERLKMMKLQYQMYFAKLVQNQTLRCIQHTTATPATAAAAAAAAAAATTTTGGGGVGGGMATIPVILQPQANAAVTPIQPWTFAMPFATPQQTSMMLQQQQQQQQQQFITPTQQSQAMPPSIATTTFTQMPLPTQTPQSMYYPELYGGIPLATSNLFDLRATLRAFDNENADLPERMATRFNIEEAAADAMTGDYRPEPTSPATPSAAAATTTTTATSATSDSTSTSTRDKGVRQLSSTSSTLATSSLTFDKLPKTLSPTHTPTYTHTPTLTLTELPLPLSLATATRSGAGQPQMPPFDIRGSRIEQQADWTNSRVTKVEEHEKSPNVVGHNEPGPGQQQPQLNNFQAYFGEMKIDEPTEDKREQNVRTFGATGKGLGMGVGVGMGMGMGSRTEVGISDDLLEEVKASRAALELAAAAVDEQLARGNQLSPPGGEAMELKPEARVSIENIENAIYGERLTGATAAGAAGAAGGTLSIPSQGLLENLVTNKTTEAEAGLHQNVTDTVAMEREPHDYGQYETGSYSESVEPIYASIDSNQQQQQQSNTAAAAAAAAVAGGTTVEPIYSEIGNPTDYQQYGTEANAGPEANSETAAPMQEYSNIDYGNYETDQYATAGYDPNAYPGYIYDEVTGQYIADPNAASYATDGSYAGQEYDGNVANYDYNAYAEQQQQQQQQQQEQQQQQLGEQQEAYPMTESSNNEQTEIEANANANANSNQPPITTATPTTTTTTAAATPSTINDAKIEPTANSSPTGATASVTKPVKPTSILSSTDKQAAPNDAQHHQQQQQQQQQKKKKRVNFVDSSETDDSSSAKPVPIATPSSASAGAAQSTPASTTPAIDPSLASNEGGQSGAGIAGSESDFDFSTGSEAKN